MGEMNMVYRVAQKECNTFDHQFQRNQGLNQILVSAVMSITFFFQQNDAKINDFDEGVLILEPFF